MCQYNFGNLSAFLEGWQRNDKYFEMLGLMAQLSRLFSENEVPYLDYRLAENLFCRYYDADNDARSCTAYDARIGQVGIGIKTFILKSNNQSVEKIAEFNRLKPQLNGFEGIDLARKLGIFRNERMEFANRQYNVNETQYHIVGRQEGVLKIFNTPYETVDINNIQLESDDETSVKFHDGKNWYTFNKSKSVLMKLFQLPASYKEIPVQILEEPLAMLEDFFTQQSTSLQLARRRIKGYDYVILPLYSQSRREGKYVPEKSGLNQFNAGGRRRDENELYIPVPAELRNMYPNFFPDRETVFALKLPNKECLTAKICQDGGKALMSNPNSALGKWLLRDVLRKAPGNIVTMEDLDTLGFDSICVEDLHERDNEGKKIYRLSFSNTDENYEQFLL